MKKSKILLVGLIALLMAGGLVLAGCGIDCNYVNHCKVEIYRDSGSSQNTVEGTSCTESSCAANKAKTRSQSTGSGTYICDC